MNRLEMKSAKQLGDTIVVPLSKLKLALAVGGSIGFVLISVWLWLKRQDAVARVFAAAGILFFGATGLFGFLKLFDSKPGLIIDPEGIVDNSSGVAAGRVRWDEIEDVFVATVQGQRFLTFIVSDPRRYLENGGALRRRMNALNLKYFGSPVHIAATTLRTNLDDLEETIRGHRAKYSQVKID